LTKIPPSIAALPLPPRKISTAQRPVASRPFGASVTTGASIIISRVSPGSSPSWPPP
jgi:hypothetical protein